MKLPYRAIFRCASSCSSETFRKLLRVEVGVSSRVGFGKKRCRKLIDWVPRFAIRHRHKRCLARAGNYGPGNIKGTVARNFGCKRGGPIALAEFRSARPNQSARAICGNKGERAASPVLTVVRGSSDGSMAQRPMFKAGRLIETNPTTPAARNSRVEGAFGGFRFVYRRWPLTDILCLLFQNRAEEWIPCGRSP